MKEDNSLVKISLQFFGEPDDDFDDNLDDEEDFDDDFDDEEKEEDDGGEDAADVDEDADNGASNEKSGDANDHSDLIANLKALGFKGDNLDELKASVKARRAAQERGDAEAEREAVKAEGKSHIKGSKPRKGADGGRSGGISERQVRGLAEGMKCTTQRARTLLESHLRKINGG